MQVRLDLPESDRRPLGKFLGLYVEAGERSKLGIVELIRAQKPGG